MSSTDDLTPTGTGRPTTTSTTKASADAAAAGEEEGQQQQMLVKMNKANVSDEEEEEEKERINNNKKKNEEEEESVQRVMRRWTASGCGEVHWERSCAAHVLRSFARNFAVGSGVKTLLNVVGFLLRKRRKGKGGVPKRPLTKFIKLVDLRWGFFLGSLATVWKAVSCLVRRAIIAHAGADPCDLNQVRALQPRFAAADVLAGAATGLSLVCIRPEDRRTLAIYSLVRSMEFFFSLLARKQLLPAWLLRLSTHLDVFLMCATAGQVLYAYAFEQDTLAPSYRNFLNVHGGKDPRVRGFIKHTHFGLPLKLDELKSFSAERKLSWEAARQDLLNFHICSVLHPHETCLQHFVSFAIAGFKRALPLYAPLHIVTTLVVLLAKLTSKVKESVKRAGSFANLSRSFSIDDFLEPGADHHQAMLVDSGASSDGDAAAVAAAAAAERKKQPFTFVLERLNKVAHRVLRVLLNRRRILRVISYTLSLVKRVLFNIVRSSVFLGVYCSAAWLAACFAHNMTWVKGPRWVRLHLTFSGLACLLEAKSRRIELAMYCVPQALNSAVNEAIKYNKLPRWLVKLRHLDIMLFCLASAITVFCYKNEPKSIRPSFYFLMKWLWA